MNIVLKLKGIGYNVSGLNIVYFECANGWRGRLLATAKLQKLAAHVLETWPHERPGAHVARLLLAPYESCCCCDAKYVFIDKETHICECILLTFGIRIFVQLRIDLGHRERAQ